MRARKRLIGPRGFLNLLSYVSEMTSFLRYRSGTPSESPPITGDAGRPRGRIPLIRILFAGAIICFLSATSAGAVSYVIELYDGSEYRVSRYWQERDEIWFDSCGGAYGVPQQDIKSIRKESDHRRLRTLEPDPCGPTQGPPLDTAKDEPTAADSTKDKPKPPVLEKYGEELTAFVKKLDQLDGLSKAELVALVAEGETLKRKMLADPEAPHLNPLLFMLYKEFDKIEEAVRQKK